MKALIIQHFHMSPTGPIGERLRYHGFELEEFLVVPEDQYDNPNIDVNFPSFEDYDLIVPLGAPWGAWDDQCIGKWLTPELQLFRDAVNAGIPVLGICFGGQLLARALGGSVGPAPAPEIGWQHIWTEDASLISAGPWFELHQDRFTVPPGAQEIARTPAASQAFTINKTLALQFHPEIEEQTLFDWVNTGDLALIRNAGLDPDILLAQTHKEIPAADKRAHALVDAYLSKVAGLI